MAGKNNRRLKKNNRSGPKNNRKPKLKGAGPDISWLGYLPAAFLFLQPLILQRFSADQFDMGKLVFLYLAAAALLIWGSAKTEPNTAVILDGVNLALLAFLAFSFISTVTSIHIPTSFFGEYQRYEGLLTTFCFVILFLFARGRNLTERRWAGIGVVASVAMVSLYGIAQGLRLDPLSWGKELTLYAGRVYSTIGNPVMLGGFLVLTLPICLGLLLNEDKRLKLVGAGAGILGLICLYLTESEGAWFGFWIGILATVFFFGVQRKKALGWMRWAAAGLFLITSTGLTWLILIGSPLFFSSSGLARIEFYRGALDMFVARPLFGWGPDTLGLVFPRFARLSYVRIWGYQHVMPTKVHNLFLEMLSTYGIFAFIAFLSLICLLIIYGSRRLKSEENDPMIPFLLGGLLGYLAFSLTGITEIGVSPTLWVLMGFLAGKPAAGSKLTLSLPKVLPVTGAFLVASVLVMTAFSQAIADRGYLLGEGLADLKSADSYYNQAERFTPYNAVIYIDHGFRWIDSGIEQNDASQWQRGIAILERGVALNPSKALGHVNLGIAYNRGAGKFDASYYTQGISALQRAAELSPLSIEAHYQLSAAFLSVERYKDALGESKKTLRIDPKHVPARLIQAGALYNLDRLDEAKKVLKQAQVLDPKNKQVKRNIEFLEGQEGR